MRLQELELIPNADQEDMSYCEKLEYLLGEDLDFHNHSSDYASHGFHSFPAKFPPQLPRRFIQALTEPGDAVLDPMMGSGTTVVESLLLGRRGIGLDIDPLALLLTGTKVAALSPDEVEQLAQDISARARLAITRGLGELESELAERWDPKTHAFVDYWFAYETQLELLALIREIEKIPDDKMRAFFELAFSAIIITKSGGVSLAFDLAHTRPHRAKKVLSRTGRVVVDDAIGDTSSSRIELLTKRLRSPLNDFQRRVAQNLRGIPKRTEEDDLKRVQSAPEPDQVAPHVMLGDAQSLPLSDGCIDLIVTSPPYASNAIDYMRAHKFSLVWLGYSIDALGQKRQEYIGGESTTHFSFEQLPDRASQVIAKIADVDERKARVLHRYYSEMTRALKEMLRVLKPGRAALVVVGSSMMRGCDTETHTCLAEIGKGLGFQVPAIGTRNLDRNRRMMPATTTPNPDSQIQQRMHQEYVIGMYKPSI